MSDVEAVRHSRDESRPAAEMWAVRVRGLVKRYAGRPVVDGVSFDVRKGEVFAILGPNGAGKTTTVEIMEGFRTADGGDVSILGLHPRRDARALRRQTGLMLQAGGIYPQLNCREAVQLFGSFFDESEDPGELLDRLDLQDAARTRFRNLSGGQKQRLSLALALVGKPRLVFLDEPTAAMDPQARRATWRIVRELRDQGVTILLTTHFMDEAEHLADRVAILNHGRLVALDSPSGLRRRASNRLWFKTSAPADMGRVAQALSLPRQSIRAEIGGELVVDAEATPDLVLRLTTWLNGEGILLTELRAGSGSLEQAFLEITADAA